MEYLQAGMHSGFRLHHIWLHNSKYMKSILFSILSLLLFGEGQAQDSVKQVLGFRLEKVKKLNDSIYEAQVLTDQRFVQFRKAQPGLVVQNMANGDTGTIGVAKLFKSINKNTHVFAIRTHQKKQLQNGDLVFMSISLERPLMYLTQSLAAKAIFLQDVYGDSLYKFLPVIFDWSDEQEENMLERFTKDIHETGKAMKAQNDGQQQTIEGGLFNGQKLFDAMVKVQTKQVAAFLKYMIARPNIYAGSCWKISEIFATWMVSKTPSIIE
jgi:hypothetical protein